MTIQPKYHWQFDEREGVRTVDTVSSIQATLSKAELNGHGRISNAIHLLKKDSHINLGKEVGQFGTSDFTVAFGMKNISNHGDDLLDIIGDQTMKSHGNFFSVRLSDRRIFFHVDEDSEAKHYVRVQTSRLSMVPNRTWFHVAVVRQGRTIKIYIDGVLAAEAESKTGVANINNSVDVKLGHSRRGTPTAQYEDLRIYHTALNAADIRTLVPPVNRPLREGEIELVATDNAAAILTQNAANLSRFSSSFKELRIGNNTGVTLYQQNSFRGTAQKCYADLPDIRLSRLENFPKSIRIWRAIEEPFTGKWVIKAPKGQFLSLAKSVLTTSPRRSLHELFRFHYNLQRTQLQLIPGSDQESTLLKISPGEDSTHLFVDDLEHLKDEFSIINQANNQWLALVEDNTFDWTGQKEDRAIFIRVAKMAESEGQVGELAPGEVALYQHRAYYGRTWILSDSDKYTSGKYTHLKDFHGLNDQTSSIRLGPDTGVTVFKNLNHQATDDKREEEIEDIVENVPRLSDRQIGNDTISSIRIFRTIAPEDVFTSYTTKLSQDYRLVGNEMEEFSAYRTTLRFEAGAGAVEVAATDQTTIEVDGITYEIDETRSATLSPNDLNFIMITSEADGLNTPGLKIQTSEMAENEQVVIFPNQEAHQQIAELEDGALWNATDAQGNLIVDRNAHSQAEVASVQNTLKRVTATVTYTDPAPAAKPSGGSRVLSSERVVSGAAIEQPWELTLTPTPDNNAGQQATTRTATLPVQGLVSVSAPGSSPGNVGIQEAAVSQDDFMRLLSQATRSEGAATPEAPSNTGTQSSGAVGFGELQPVFAVKRLKIGRSIKNAVKRATSVVVGAAEDVVHVIVKTAEEVTDFVVNTVEEVAEFVEAVVETVVNGIKKFIEFLQFLFNWGDILDTQRYLVRAINDGFDYAVQQVEAIKAPVSNFMDTLQETVEEGINQLVTTLGDESEVQASGLKLPEAAEWFLSKLLGGSKQNDAEPTPQLGTPPSGDSGLENFLFQFTEAFEDRARAVHQEFELLDETIATIIANPLKPQLAVIVLVETLRDVVMQMLEAIENLVLGFLDAIAGAVEQLKKLLNAEIKIPFISDLFRLIGAGKLTLLNLTGLLLAIPVTVVSKLIFGETPFKNVPPLDLAPQTGARLVAEQEVSFQRTNNTRRENSIRHWGNTGLLADVMNGMITAYLDVLPESSDDPYEETAGFGFEIVSLVLDGFSWLASFPSSPDFPGGRPYNVAAHAVSKSKDEQEYWERVMWGWRTALYWLDVVIFMGQEVAAANGIDVKRQRLKRANEFTIAIFTVFSIVDAGLAIRYLFTIPKEEKPGLEIANEVVSWLPNLLALVRLNADPRWAAALSVVDGVAAFANYGMGHKLLTDDLAEV
ncbi:MAG: LamG domain-containing protein [Leptolyngbyaceae cyanobacterium]